MSIRTLAAHIAFLALAVDYTISSTLLTAFGSSYVSEGGSLLAKIHPGSYLAILAGVMCGMDRLHGAVGLRQLVARDSYTCAFVLGVIFCCLFALACTGSGELITLIDSFLPAGMLALAFSGLEPPVRLRLRHMLQGLLVANACLAILESVTQLHLVPIALSGGPDAAEFRSAALYDHPLTGASATMMGLFLGPNMNLHKILGLSYSALIVAALLSFGERTPLALAALSVAVCYSASLYGKILRRHLQWRDASPVFATLAIVLVLSAAALATGFGSRLSDHLYWDASAQVRLAQFGILNSLSTAETILGCQRAELISLIEPMRLAAGVQVLENFWLVMLVSLGLLCFPVFVASLFALLWSMWRTSDLEGRLMILSLMIAASASNSFGRKSTLLAMLVGCVAATTETARKGLRGVQNRVVG